MQLQSRKAAYSVVNDCFKSVLNFLAHPVALQYVDDAEVNQQPLAFVISSRDATRPVKEIKLKKSVHGRLTLQAKG